MQSNIKAPTSRPVTSEGVKKVKLIKLIKGEIFALQYNCWQITSIVPQHISQLNIICYMSLVSLALNVEYVSSHVIQVFSMEQITVGMKSTRQLSGNVAAET